MTVDEAQPLAAMEGARHPDTAGALLRLIRLSQAETRDISLFVAPSRLQVFRKLLVSGLFSGTRTAPRSSNDN